MTSTSKIGMAVFVLDIVFPFRIQISSGLALHVYNSSQVRALVAGGCASLVGQTFIVPFDVISQHLMVIGQRSGHAK